MSTRKTDRCPIWVAKSGSSLVTEDTGTRIRGWMREISRLKRESGVGVVWVFSGTLAYGGKSLKTQNRQALGAVGQMELSRAFSEALTAEGLVGAEVLISAKDFEDPQKRGALETLLRTLLDEGVVPILNENDAREELAGLFGNNDRMAAELSLLLGADRLVFLTEVDGVYSTNPHTDPHARKYEQMESTDLERVIAGSAAAETSATGTGGMLTKLAAARAAVSVGTEVFIGRDFQTGTRVIAEPGVRSFGEGEDPIASIRGSARVLGLSSITLRNRVLAELEKQIELREAEILAANRADVAALPETATTAFRERMSLNPARMREIRQGVAAVLDAPDPLAHSESDPAYTSPYGLKIRRVRSPLGVLFMIFESRPNVAVEGFAAAVKSGNALILRGGKECARTLGVFYAIFAEVLETVGLPTGIFCGITDPNREIVRELLLRKDVIDVLIPRGGGFAHRFRYA